MKKMRILVVGCGSIGQRHIRNLLTLPDLEIVACDVDEDQRDSIAAKHQLQTYCDFEKALNQEAFDAVVVATPPNFHLPVTASAIERGVSVFVEKPISHRLDGLDDLIQSAEEKGLVLCVGYNFRFHPGIRKMKKALEDGVVGKVLWARVEVGQYLPDWRPQTDYRQVYTAHEAMGGGIILDGSHEIDYLRWLMGEMSEVFCFAGRLSSLEVKAEDTAALLVRFENGAIGELHLDFVQRAYSRSCKIVGEKGTLLWDWDEKVVKVYTAEDGEWASYPHAEFEPNDMYVEEIKHFLRCLRGEERPLVDGETGKRILEIALAAKESARRGKLVRI